MRARVIRLLLAAIGIGCAGRGTPVATIDTHAPQPAKPPARPTVPMYDSDEHPSKSRTGAAVEQWIVEQIHGIASSRRGARLSRDERLDATARDVAASYRMNDPVGIKELTALALRHGYPFPEFALLFLSAATASQPEDLSSLRGDMSSWLSPIEHGRFGVGIVEKPEGMRIVLLATEARVEFKPVPRTLSPGTTVAVAGRVHAPYASPEVLVTTPKGTVERLAANPGKERFDARLACGRTAGVYRLEIVGTSASGPRALAIFPVYCGVPAPTEVEVRPRSARTEKTVADVETTLHALLNAERIKHGLPSLRIHPVLARAARGYSKEMAENAKIEHVSQRSGLVLDRVRRAGLEQRPSLLGENIAHVYSAGEAHDGFLDSPGHRANMLNPAFTDVGIGAVAKDEPGGVRAFYVTEVFAAF